MQQDPKIATGKIVGFIAFICAAIVTSLFVYHLNHQNPVIQTASENSMLFPAGRDIKDFSLVASSGKPFTQNDFRKHWTLLFFGFTHCPDICPTTMSMISNAYKELHSAHPELQVVLVSLDPERDNPATLAKYMATFNPAFIGISGKVQDIRKLQSQLGIYSARKDNGDNNNYRLEHTTSIMLINPQGKWVGLFKYGMKPSDFAAEFDTNVKLLAKQSA